MKISAVLITFNEEANIEAALRSLEGIADEIVVVADSSKIGVSHLQSILALDAMNTLVTDSGAPPALLRSLEDRGARVIVVPVVG